MDLEINSKSLAELDIAEVVITYVNQAVDTAKITLNADSIADIPNELKPGAQCVLSYGQGRFVFWGTILIPEESATSGEQNVILYAESTEGRLLRDTMRTGSVQAWNGSALTANVLEKVILQGTIYQVLVAAASQVCQLGSIDLPYNIPFPTEEHTNISCLDVIRRALSYVPGAQMWFDYSGWRPRFNVARADSANLRTSIPTDYVSHGLKLLNSSKLKRVRFSYIRPVRLYGPPDDAPKNDLTPIDVLELAGTDASSTLPVAKDELNRTIELPGSVDVYTTQMRYNKRSLGEIFNGARSNTSSDEQRFKEFWARYGIDVGAATYYFASGRSMTITSWVSDPYWTQSVWQGIEMLTIFEAYDPDTGLTWTPHDMLYYRRGDYTAGIPFFLADITITKYQTSITYTAKNVLLTTNRYSRMQRLTRTIRSGQTTVPTGTAQEIQTAFNRDQYEGSITLDQPNDIWEQFDLSRGNLQLSGVNISGVSRREYVASTDTFRLTFGPPRHLSPSEHIRHKMFRSQK